MLFSSYVSMCSMVWSSSPLFLFLSPFLLILTSLLTQSLEHPFRLLYGTIVDSASLLSPFTRAGAPLLNF
jgi:hypothetical protein